MMSMDWVRWLTIYHALVVAVPRPEAAGAGGSGSPPREAAATHYDKGLIAFDQKRYEVALREFEAAYELTPSYKVLYEIGLVNVRLGRPLEAIEAFEGYLATGRNAVDEDRKMVVMSTIKGQQRSIERRRLPIGTLTVTTAPS